MPKSQVIDFSKIKASCSDCNLHELCLPRGLNLHALEQLEHTVKRTRPLQSGDHIFRAGDRFEHIYAIRSGSVKLNFIDEQGDDQIIGFYFPGEILGLDAIDKRQHICTAIALETSSYCAFPFNSITEICQTVPELQQQMFRLMSRELTQENELLLTINRKSAEVKLATFLITLSSRFHRLGYSAREFKLSMSRQEIANYLGLTIETVSRIMSRFQLEDIIIANRKQITIKNIDALREISAGCRGGGNSINYSR
ncbi:MAG TPA: fumarate/nitrate reduction transcriptional regulator Fnr [Gammaproteobacteria bacterium]|nr:fumarate/nitrate reduction transcriptional regulator Fnr [Gammaproteobacteria bacterium]